MLIVTVVLISVDVMEIRRLVVDWTEIPSLFTPEVFDSCFKYELITKTAFNLFSLAAAFSALLLTLLILIDIDFFLAKTLDAYLHFNYFVFGPLMLCLCSLAFFNFHQSFMVCDHQNTNRRFVSVSNVMACLLCLIISLIVTTSVSVYSSLNDLISSILRQDGSIPLVRKVFLWAVYRNRNVEENVQRLDEEVRLNVEQA